MPNSKKKKKNYKKRGIKVVEQKKRVFRASEPLLSVFMWGINYSVCALHILVHVEEKFVSAVR